MVNWQHSGQRLSGAAGSSHVKSDLGAMSSTARILLAEDEVAPSATGGAAWGLPALD